MKKSKKPELSFRFRRHRSERPLHKRLALHPLSIFVMLCAGVLIAASTWRASADTIDVGAKVAAPLPPKSAIITSPHDQQHVTEVPIDVVGTCPDDSYVELYRESAFSGVAQCESGNFTIQTSLFEGVNQLQARVYNITDDEGPMSPSITIYSQAVTSPNAPSESSPNSSSASASSGGDVAPLVVAGDYKYQLHYAGDPFSWKLQVNGGVGPYSVTVTWGDGEETTYQSADGVLNLSHIYKKGGDYQPIVRITDANGTVVLLQLSAIVKDTPLVAVTTLPFAADVGRYLGVLEPTYIAIGLMVVSFWLGELEVTHYVLHKIWGRIIRRV
jgi:hypothetical protein